MKRNLRFCKEHCKHFKENKKHSFIVKCEKMDKFYMIYKLFDDKDCDESCEFYLEFLLLNQKGELN